MTSATEVGVIPVVNKWSLNNNLKLISSLITPDEHQTFLKVYVIEYFVRGVTNFDGIPQMRLTEQEIFN